MRLIESRHRSTECNILESLVVVPKVRMALILNFTTIYVVNIVDLCLFPYSDYLVNFLFVISL